MKAITKAIQRSGNWISVEERLPDIVLESQYFDLSEQVLCYCEGSNDSVVARFVQRKEDGRRFWSLTYIAITTPSSPTYWQHLPKKPE